MSLSDLIDITPVYDLLRSLVPLLVFLGGFPLGWTLANKMKAWYRSPPKVEKRKNDDFGYEGDKPKRLVLNEDGELEGWE